MKWLYVLLATFLLTSCGTLMQPYQMDSKMKDIELGMTKKKVISILGKDFESAGGRLNSPGSVHGHPKVRSKPSATRQLP